MSEPIGQKILDENDLCESCREKIKKETAKLSIFSLLNPNRIAIKFLNCICKECKVRCIAKVKARSGGN